MANKHTPKDDDEKIMKENVQKRFKNMFSGENQPLSNLSIQEVEALKARVSELEAALTLEPKSEGRVSIHEKENRLRPASPITAISSTPNEAAANKTRRSFWKPFAGRATKLSTKVIISTLFIFSLVLAGFLLYSYLTAQADNQARALDLSLQAEGSFNSKIQNLNDFALGLAIEAANNPEIQAAFAERDRQKLKNLTLASYLALDEEFGIPQYQYHLSPAVSFLRLHSLERFGDDLSTFRATVMQVNQTKQSVAGLEVGRGGMGLRGVVPVFFESRHIGSVEFGLNIDEGLVKDLKQEYGNDWRIILTREALALATLEDISALKEGPTPDLLVLASTSDAGYPDIETYNEVLGGERQMSAITDSQERSYSITSLPLRDYSGKVIGVVEIIIDQTALVQAQINRFRLIFLVGVAALLLGSYSLATITNRNLRPLGTLTKAADAIQKGDLNQQIQVVSQDEIGQLGHTFNAMTLQLRSLVEGLERRVTERTHDLELASEVGRTATEKVTNLSEMLTDAAEMIRTRFDLYYTQIYLMDPSGERIVLRAGTGEVGKQLLERGHHLIINSNSLNGRAVLDKSAQIVPDTQESPSFLPNPLLPNTRSEMSIPLVVGEKVVGVLDMQSEHPGALSESNLPAFEALARQLAIAVENAALFAEVQEARSEAETQIHRFTEQGWQEFLDAVRQAHRIGFAFDESRVIRLKPDALSADSDDGVRLPLNVTGTRIGEIYLPNSALSASELELAQTTGAQLAQHVENLRLLAQAQQYREEAEQAVRRLTHEGWDSFLQTHAELELGYTFDLTEVKPLSEKNGNASSFAVKHPMVVGAEIIGELAVDLSRESDEATEVIESIAQQLSAHVENLRLSELNEKHAQREQTLRQITSTLRGSNNPTTILRTAVRELGSIMGRRAVVQLVSPQQAESAGENKNESDAPAHQS